MQRNRVIAGGKIPQHVGIIMDGNGRWARSRFLPRTEGHVQGARRMKGLVRRALSLGVDHVTLYALSTENLKRPKEELEKLFDLFRAYYASYFDELQKNEEVRVRVLGDVSLLPTDICLMIEEIEKRARTGRKSVNFAVAYGGRSEIVNAVNQAVKNGELVTEESLKSYLTTKDLPDPDLIIRTGKEMRLSNFLLYQSAYAELYFSKKMFPDFTNRDLERAFCDYAKRRRRYGKTETQSGEN